MRMILVGGQILELISHIFNVIANKNEALIIFVPNNSLTIIKYCLKEKRFIFTCIRSKKNFLYFVENLTKNVALLICKSKFDNTILFSGIPYK
jgi:hypothetical protein